ncbi:MAG: NADP-dependent malic enzyme [Lewinellaceae bacterium]|nr:NADP-dependent malic enzyme [Saprospiraceae bacterium]MCB9308014.1 NADP-dependent malic enzyme [Lewinellaceae bacterium]MCB9354489.1 NADP-dependent malic enzyme [Lewinellaceae bacterium]
MAIKDFTKASLDLHEQHKGKISVRSKMPVTTQDDLSTVYSPGVAAPCQAIADNPEDVYKYTIKGNTVAVVSDGSAVLGLGNIGPEAAIPVMEGKAMLFKKFANIDAFPICVASQETEEIVRTVRNIAPVFGGINLEDISAPHCFVVEEHLQDLGIPVFHDDQHGTAVVTLAGLINASRVLDKPLNDMKIVINGAGAAGIAIAKLLKGYGLKKPKISVREIILCDRSGIVHSARTDLNEYKRDALLYTNPNDISGNVFDALHGADVFIGVSQAKLLKPADIRTMANDAIVFALANPTPEIMPEEAYEGGAAIVGTGRSDLPNQVNNVLGFPGIFRGALDARAPRITMEMKLAAAHAIASCVKEPHREMIIPGALNKSVARKVAKAVFRVAMKKKAATSV